MRLWLVILTVVALMAHAGPAFAQSDDERVEELSAEGLKLYNLAEYDKAIEKFQQAYRLRALPEFLYNIAQAHRLARHCRKALQVYKSYLRAAPDASNRAKVLEHIDEMRACAATEPATGATHEPEPVVMTEPEPKPEPESKPKQPQPKRAKPAPATRPQPATSADVAASPSRKPGRIATYTGVGVMAAGAVAAGFAVAFSRDAADAERRISERFVEGGAWQSADVALEQDGLRSARRARWSIAASTVLVLGGAGLVFLGRHQRRAEAQLTVTASPSGASVMWSRGW